MKGNDFHPRSQNYSRHRLYGAPTTIFKQAEFFSKYSHLCGEILGFRTFDTITLVRGPISNVHEGGEVGANEVWELCTEDACRPGKQSTLAKQSDQLAKGQVLDRLVLAY